MKHKSPKNLTLSELPAYFDQLITEIENKNTGHVRPSELRNLKNASKDLKSFTKSAISTITDMQLVLGMETTINN